MSLRKTLSKLGWYGEQTVPADLTYVANERNVLLLAKILIGLRSCSSIMYTDTVSLFRVFLGERQVLGDTLTLGPFFLPSVDSPCLLCRDVWDKLPIRLW